jgi:hypothetical protein
MRLGNGVKGLAAAAMAGVLGCIGCAWAGNPADAQSQILRLDTEWSQAAQALVVSRSGDLAYGTGTNRVTLTGADGKQVAIEGVVTVWRRGKEGEWKCVVDIWNDTVSSLP